jgi:hypothetical protein
MNFGEHRTGHLGQALAQLVEKEKLVAGLAPDHRTSSGYNPFSRML